MATKTVIKKYVKYYVSVSNTTTGDVSFYEKETNNEDYSPFIEYEENSSWNKIDELPNTELFLLKFATSTITVPKNQNQSDETLEKNEDENIETEEQSLELTYYYNYYETNVDLDRYIKVICIDCKYCNITEKFRKKYNCSYSEHTFVDYVSGEIKNGECQDFNENGECRFFLPIELDEEDTKNTETKETDSSVAGKDNTSDDKTTSNTDNNPETSSTENNSVDNSNENEASKTE